MKKIFFVVLALAAIGFFAFKYSIDPLPIGSSLPNPNKKMRSISGKEVSFKDVVDKEGLLVMFSCNTCPVVRAYQSRTIEVCKYAADKHIGVILVNTLRLILFSQFLEIRYFLQARHAKSRPKVYDQWSFAFFNCLRKFSDLNGLNLLSTNIYCKKQKCCY